MNYQFGRSLHVFDHIRSDRSKQRLQVPQLIRLEAELCLAKGNRAAIRNFSVRLGGVNRHQQQEQQRQSLWHPRTSRSSQVASLSRLHGSHSLHAACGGNRRATVPQVDEKVSTGFTF